MAFLNMGTPMITTKFILTRIKIVTILLICLAAILILPSCRKKQGDKKEYITLQFEKVWLGRPTGQFFEVSVDPNDSLFSRTKEIPAVPRYAESDYQSSALKNDVISIIGTTAEPVHVIDTSPDGRWASVKVKVLQHDDEKDA
jgi:hypothetical protein